MAVNAANFHKEIDAAARKTVAPVTLDSDKKYRKRDENSSTVTISISLEDKAKLKYFASKRGKNVLDLLHFWIVREEQEVGLA